MTTLDTSKIEKIKEAIRDIPDFPKEGINFKDITTLLSNPEVFNLTIDLICEQYKGQKVDFVACPESRGFIFGAPVSTKINAGMTLIRKPGKLPAKTFDYSYELEYGTDTLQIHEDAFAGVENPNVIIVDDLLATGGSCTATAELIKKAGGNVLGASFVIELSFIPGRKKLEDAGIKVNSLVTY